MSNFQHFCNCCFLSLPWLVRCFAARSVRRPRFYSVEGSFVTDIFAERVLVTSARLAPTKLLETKPLPSARLQLRPHVCTLFRTIRPSTAVGRPRDNDQYGNQVTRGSNHSNTRSRCITERVIAHDKLLGEEYEAKEFTTRSQGLALSEPGLLARPALEGGLAWAELGPTSSQGLRHPGSNSREHCFLVVVRWEVQGSTSTPALDPPPSSLTERPICKNTRRDDKAELRIRNGLRGRANGRLLLTSATG